MESLSGLFHLDAVAQSLMVLACVIAFGLVLGSIRIFGISLGVAGVLFSGILFGHFDVTIVPETAEFVREFGLILFVYTIGMQVGPGFFASLKKDGASLNVLAVWIVLSGAVITVLLSRWGNIPFPVAAGMFSGATTNTPSLAAAQQALKEIPGITADALKMPGLGYAVCYPFGIVGIILTMIAVRAGFKIDPKKEAEKYACHAAKSKPPLEVIDLKVENANLDGRMIDQLPLPEKGVVLSRVMHEGIPQIALPDSRLFIGDVVRAVGAKEQLEDLKIIIGREVKIDWGTLTQKIITQRVIVTRREVAGKTLEDLDPFLYGVTVTRISRSEIEFPASPEIEINFADTLMVVGEERAIQKFSSIVGNSVKQLNHPELVPIFVGIAAGVLLGSWPFQIPGMPVPIKLGLAGGPLIVAILLSRIGRIGKLIWYMPVSANFMLREIGISLFLASVGLRSGGKFAEILFEGQGLYWMFCGALITVVPLALAALWMRLKSRMNYLTICGLLAGSMTDPPALAFANQIAPSSAQVVSYAAVYPMVMLLRVVCAQVLVILFSH